MSSTTNLILATQSPYKKALLDRLQLSFTTLAPHIDESLLEGEAPETYVQRLAREKAEKIAQMHPDAVVIGCDQAPVCEGRILSKPGSAPNAKKQLEFLSGKTVIFYTAISVIHKKNCTNLSALTPFEVRFRKLTGHQIQAYIDREPAFDCAGSFKSEGLGITLCESLRGEDPTALVGLPLITTINLLKEAGIDVL